jgi:hypothetical protein
MFSHMAISLIVIYFLPGLRLHTVCKRKELLPARPQRTGPAIPRLLDGLGKGYTTALLALSVFLVLAIGHLDPCLLPNAKGILNGFPSVRIVKSLNPYGEFDSIFISLHTLILAYRDL